MRKDINVLFYQSLSYKLSNFLFSILLTVMVFCLVDVVNLSYVMSRTKDKLIEKAVKCPVDNIYCASVFLTSDEEYMSFADDLSSADNDIKVAECFKVNKEFENVFLTNKEYLSLVELKCDGQDISFSSDEQFYSMYIGSNYRDYYEIGDIYEIDGYLYRIEGMLDDDYYFLTDFFGEIEDIALPSSDIIIGEVMEEAYSSSVYFISEMELTGIKRVIDDYCQGKNAYYEVDDLETALKKVNKTEEEELRNIKLVLVIIIAGGILMTIIVASVLFWNLMPRFAIYIAFGFDDKAVIRIINRINIFRTLIPLLLSEAIMHLYLLYQYRGSKNVGYELVLRYHFLYGGLVFLAMAGIIYVLETLISRIILKKSTVINMLNIKE